MRPSLLPQPLLAFILAATTSAQLPDDYLSFGHKTPISSDGRSIPNYQLQSSSNNQVQILSDRIILTPPVPGNAQAAIWSDRKTDSDQWTAEVEFRASGQDGGSGNLQLWFVRDKSAIGLASVYNVNAFDGLALMLDQYGGRGGSIRGFLNDGSQDYAAKGNQESLAFGHCDYSYRNLGRPSKLKVSSRDGLSVSIDDKPCFSSNQIQLPVGYHFGITARTAENPDSFEVSRLAISTGLPREQGGGGGAVQKGPPQQQRDNGRLEKLDNSHLPNNPPANQQATQGSLLSSDAQFQDLHARMQGLTQQVASVFAEFNTLAKQIDERHNQMLERMPQVPGPKIDEIGRRLESVERTVESVKKAVEGNDYKEHLSQLNAAIEGVKGGLTENLPENISQCEFFLSFVHLVGRNTDYVHSDLGLGPPNGHVHLHHRRRADHAGGFVHRVQATKGEHAEEVLVDCFSSLHTIYERWVGLLYRSHMDAKGDDLRCVD